MYTVLVNAYAVSPKWGSEPGMGWNWVVNLSRFCDLHIITEGEWRDAIEESIQAAQQGDMSGEHNPTKLTKEQADHLHFYYLPVSEKVRKMCWNQGDWRFYYYYRKWQDLALKKAKEIMEEVDVDIVHQLNMIGYREPGMMWKIEDKPFVWGPIGGLELMPESYLKGESFKLIMANLVKNRLNRIQRSTMNRFKNALNRADSVVCATKGVYEYITQHYKPDAVLINETGCSLDNSDTQSHRNTNSKSTLDIMWVGKFDFRKQLGIALQTMSMLKDSPEIKLHVYGTGSEASVSRYKQMALDLGVKENVIFYGVQPNTVVHDAMKSCDLFFFTSIMDATSTVVLEAISYGLPVICLNTCGFGPLIDDEIGRKVELSNPKNNIKEFANVIKDLNANRSQIETMSQNCEIRRESISWKANAEKMVEQYSLAIDRFHSKNRIR